MTELGDIDALAGEYVLGTLDIGEREAVEERRLSEPELDQAIKAWERRLAPLMDTVRPLSPPANLYNKVRARIGLSAHVVSLRAREQRLVQRASLWRNATAGMTALAASLVGFIGWREAYHAQVPTQYVAVLQAGADKPAFLLTVDTKTQNCVISAIAAPKQPQKSYEVWMVSDQLKSPKSLGVMAEGDMHVMPMDDGPETAMFMNATFAVSLEPEGGSPSGAPTGPVLYQAKLFKATP
jgi:anti-sigma-K factor RskA